VTTNLNLRGSAGARVAAAHNDQKPVLAAIRANGGTDIVQLVSLNAVAAHVSAAGVAALRALPAVKEIIPDATVPIGDPEPTGPKVEHTTITPDKTGSRSARAAGTNPFPTVNNCGTADNPLIEPEALDAIHAPAMTNAGLATEPGHGVIVANDGISTAPDFSLVGNPNFVRPAADGGGSVVVGATPGDATDATDGEYYGDASSIAAQGAVVYQYSKELPYSGMPDSCYFKLVGDAPGASLVDTENIDTPESAAKDPATKREPQLLAGIDAAVLKAHADVINGPSPALVKQLLTGTATDVSAPADQQGAGLVNIKVAVAAAQQQPNTTMTGSAAGLVPTPTELDLRGAGGSTGFESVSLYNPSNASTTVTGTYRELGPERQIGQTVTENVSAPDISLSVPADGAQAAPDISFTVPAGLDRLDADMIWPDPTNGAILSFTLTDPTGRLRQISYDYGTASATGIGTVPDIGHVEVANPEAGTWKVAIKWANGRAHLQSVPNVPGSYRGTVSFKASGQNWITAPASPEITIGAHRAATIPLQVAFPDAPGDHPESVQFAAANGATTSIPIARRALIPSAGGEFDTQITSTVGRGVGQISTYNIDVPAGRPDLGVTLTTPDASADNPMTLFLVNPAGTSVATHTVTTGNPPRTRT
jgi:hypothetical protein